VICRFARPYAKAFMEIAVSAADRESLLSGLKSFESARKSSSELAQLFENPAVDLDRKEKVTAEISKRLELAPLVVRVLNVLVQNHRINQLESIIFAFRDALNRSTGTQIAKIRAAHELSSAERASLKQSLETKFGGKIDLDVSTDPSLIGGFVAEVGSEIYDASLTGQIQKFRQSLV